MSSYILVDRNVDHHDWWQDLILTCAVFGETFEIHCWSDERKETELALRYGKKVQSSWHGGIVIRETITREFLQFLTQMPKPTDTEIYNKMTPFFTIHLGKRLFSEHYGTEMIIPKVEPSKENAVDRILDEMAEQCTVHRDLG